jgi:RHS repeat-associated protein
MVLNFANGNKIMAGVMTLYGIDQDYPLVSFGNNRGTGPTTSVTLAGQPGDLAMDILAAYCGHEATPGEGQTTRWDQLWTNYAWNRRGATSSELVSGSSVTMSYTFGSCDYGYVAAVFRDAAGATPTPTHNPRAKPNATPPVPTPPSGQIWRSYYFAGSQRIALRVAGDPVQANNGVFYLLADHLGSTNVVVDEDGDMVRELRYTAWGETRYASGSPNTDYRYTGQRQEPGIGLYYYHARWYDPILGRFAHADTIIPFGQSPIARDRYAYASDNPLRFVDPSGHMIDWGRNEGFDWNPAQEEGYQHYVSVTSRPPGDVGVWTREDTKRTISASVFTVTALVLASAAPEAPALLDKCLWSFQIQTVKAAWWVQNSVIGSLGALLQNRFSLSETAKLQEIATRAANDIDSLGNSAFSPAQLSAIEDHPGLGAAFRGFEIHRRFFSLVADEMPNLRLARPFQFGPDVINEVSWQWWDLTTFAEWPAHVVRYDEIFGSKMMHLHY